MGLFDKQPDEYDINDIIDLLGVSRTAVQKYINQKKFPAEKRGRFWFIKKEDFNKFLEEKIKKN